MRQNIAQQFPPQLVVRRAHARFLDQLARIVGQMPVIDAAWACRHAGVAGQAAVEMRAHLPGRRLSLKHRLDEIDAAPRAVAFVAEQKVCRAGGDAEAAMDAAPQDIVGLLQAGIAQLFESEVRFHDFQTPAYMRPGLRTPAGSKAFLIACTSFILVSGSG